MAWNKSDASEDCIHNVQEDGQKCGAAHKGGRWLYLLVIVCVWTVILWILGDKVRSSSKNLPDQVEIIEDGKDAECLTLLSDGDLLKDEEDCRRCVEQGPPYDIWYEFCKSNDWNVSRESFVVGHQGVDRSDVSSKEVRLFGEGIRFHGFSACEARVRFRSYGASDVFVSVFNKGDRKAVMSTSSAYRYIADFKGMMNGNGTPLSAPERVSVGANEWIDYYAWTESAPQFVLSCGYARTGNDVVVEFVNVHMFIKEEEYLPKTGEQLRANCIEDDGDVWIAGVPMVDQGEKGYCVPCTLERVLRYLGLRADMHELALALQTKCRGNGGTPIEESMQGLDYATACASLNRLDCFEMSASDDEVLRWYNMAAIEDGRQPLNQQDFIDEREDEQGETIATVNWNRLKSCMDRDVLEGCREFDQHGLGMFAKGVQAAVADGLPLVWCVKKSLPFEECFFRMVICE